MWIFYITTLHVILSLVLLWCTVKASETAFNQSLDAKTLCEVVEGWGWFHYRFYRLLMEIPSNRSGPIPLLRQHYMKTNIKTYWLAVVMKDLHQIRGAAQWVDQVDPDIHCERSTARQMSIPVPVKSVFREMNMQMCRTCLCSFFTSPLTLQHVVCLLSFLSTSSKNGT